MQTLKNKIIVLFFLTGIFGAFLPSVEASCPYGSCPAARSPYSPSSSSSITSEAAGGGESQGGGEQFYMPIRSEYMGSFDLSLTRSVEQLRNYSNADQEKKMPWYKEEYKKRGKDFEWNPFANCTFTKEDYKKDLPDELKNIEYEYVIFTMMESTMYLKSSKYMKQYEKLGKTYMDILDQPCLPEEANPRSAFVRFVQEAAGDQWSREKKRIAFLKEIAATEEYSDGLEKNGYVGGFDIIHDLNEFEKRMVGEQRYEKQENRPKLGDKKSSEPKKEEEEKPTFNAKQPEGSPGDKDNKMKCDQKKIPKDVHSHIDVQNKCFYKTLRSPVQANGVTGEGGQTPICEKAVNRVNCNLQVTPAPKASKMPKKTEFTETTTMQRWENFVTERATAIGLRGVVEGTSNESVDSLRDHFIAYAKQTIDADKGGLIALSDQADDLIKFVDRRFEDLMIDQTTAAKITHLSIYTKNTQIAINRVEQILAGIYTVLRPLEKGEKHCNEFIIPFEKILTTKPC